MNQDKKENLKTKQSDSFMEKRNILREYVKLNQVFTNTQIRTKIYGQKVNGVQDVALTEIEKQIAFQDLFFLENVITEFKEELK